jgi:hypothetical protein
MQGKNATPMVAAIGQPGTSSKGQPMNEHEIVRRAS